MDRKLKNKDRAPVFVVGNTLESRLKAKTTTHDQDSMNDIGEIWKAQRYTTAIKGNRKVSEKVMALAHLALERLTRLILSVKNRFEKRTKQFSNKKVLAGGLALILIVVGGLVFSLKSDDAQNPNSLGVSVSGNLSQRESDQNNLPLDFQPLYPAGVQDNPTVTRQTPSGEIIHTYGDELAGTQIEVTQQKLPSKFRESGNIELATMAKNFLADRTIQVNDLIIYYGIDEKTGVQSLFFIKNESLFSVRSASQLKDDIWAAYIASLQ